MNASGSELLLEANWAGWIKTSAVISIEGVVHRISVEGRAGSPALLWLDGGLGSGEFGSVRTRNSELFDHFLVFHDSHGFHGVEDEPSDAARRAIVNQTSRVVDVVRAATREPRIILVGHSIGAALGLALAWERQDALHAYVGVNQPIVPVGDFLLRVRLVLAQAVSLGAAYAARQLDPLPAMSERSDLTSFAHYISSLHKLTRDPADLVLWAAANESELPEDVDVTTAEASAMRTWLAFSDFDALAHVPPFDIPLFVVAGRHDPVVPVELIRRYVDAVYAPGLTRLVEFERSGHFAYWEEADAFNELMLGEVLATTGREPVIARHVAEASTPMAKALTAVA